MSMRRGKGGNEEGEEERKGEDKGKSWMVTGRD